MFVLISKDILHYHIKRGILDNDFPPSIKTHSDIFKTDEEQDIIAI